MPGRKHDQILEVASLERQIVDGLVVEGSSEDRGRSVDERSGFFHLHRLRNAAGLEVQIDANVFRYLEADYRAFGFLEARNLRGDAVESGLESGSNIRRGIVGNQSAKPSFQRWLPSP